jgi:hypothetical protein
MVAVNDSSKTQGYVRTVTQRSQFSGKNTKQETITAGVHRCNACNKLEIGNKLICKKKKL